MTYPLVKNIDRTLRSNVLYTGLTNRDQLVIYNLRPRMIPSLFEWLPNSVEAALAIIKLKPPIRAVVELNKQRQIFESKTNQKSLISLLTRGKNTLFAARALQLSDSRRINNTVLFTSGSISITLLLPDKRQNILTSPAILSFFAGWRDKKTQWRL